MVKRNFGSVPIYTLLLNLLLLIAVISASASTALNHRTTTNSEHNHALSEGGNGDDTGAKVSISQNALNYISHQFKPILEKKLDHINVPDLDKDVHTPIGKVKLKVKDIKLSDLSISAPELKVDKGHQDLLISINKLHAHGNCEWHYRKKHWPHVSDHGSGKADVTLGLSVRVKILIKDQDHFDVKVTDMNSHFSHFDIKLHGGASWLYNIFISAFKGDIKKSVRKSIDKQVPDAINKAVTKALSSVSLVFPVGAKKYNVYVDFGLKNIAFGSSTNPHLMTIGTLGAFKRKNSPQYPGSPSNIPDKIGGKTNMIEILLSDYSFNTASYAFYQAGVMQTLVTDKNIPSSVPFNLNTKYFKSFIPKLYSYCPDCPMQLNMTAVKAPVVQVNPSIGCEIMADGAAVFQVINGSSVHNAFSLNLDLKFNMTAHVNSGNITGKIAYENITMSVSHSEIGNINVSGLDSAMKFVFKYVIVPFANGVTEKGVPLPHAKGLDLKNSKISYQNGYLGIASDFTYNPPSTRTIYTSR